MIVRHPAVCDLRNAKNRARWAMRYYGGQHFPDGRDVELFRRGEWIALQMSWRRGALNERRARRIRIDTEELA